MKTMICILLDRSGSMQGQEDDVVGGVNAFIEEQKALPDPATIALVRFDSLAVERFRPMGPLSEAKPIERSDFAPRGGTPLLDAVGRTIAELDEDWKREQPERCVMVIVTDGQENQSIEFTRDKVKGLIKARQDSGKWAFVYLGADVDAFTEASNIGIPMANAAGWTKTSAGISAMYSAASGATRMMRETGQTVASLGGNIEEDGTVTKAQDKLAAGSWAPPA